MSGTAAAKQGKSVTETAAEDQGQDVANQQEGPAVVGTAVDREGEVVGTAVDREGEVVVIGDDKDIADSLWDDAKSEEYVTLTKDVVEEFYYPNTKRPAYRTLYAAGQTVQKRALVDHNERVAAAKRGPLEGEALAADLIDNSTLASGTSPGIGALESKSNSGSSAK